jgi:hypothetical protein
VLLVVGGGILLVHTRRRWKAWLQTHRAPEPPITPEPGAANDGPDRVNPVALS